MRKGANRCVNCGPFKKWENLTLVDHRPDSEEGGETMEYKCKSCLDSEKEN